jgi:hypothetical protein
MRPAGFNPSATPDANKFIVGIENYRTLLSTKYRKVTTRTYVHGALLLVGLPAIFYSVMNATTPGGSQLLRDQMQPQKDMSSASPVGVRADSNTVSTPIALNRVDVFGPRTPLADVASLDPYTELVIAARQYNEDPARARNWVPDTTHYIARSLPAAPPAAYGDIARRAQSSLSAYAESRGYHAEPSMKIMAIDVKP